MLRITASDVIWPSTVATPRIFWTLVPTRRAVTSSISVSPGTTGRRNLAYSIELKNGIDLDPVVLGDLLVDAGFTREDPVDEHGEFCVRGGIVDYFPAGADNPIRVEFVGETIESIRRYDPSTQRSIETLDQAAVVPLTEKSGSATFFDYLPGDRDLSFILIEEEDASAQANKLLEQTQASFEEAKAENPTAPAPDELLMSWSEVAERLRLARVRDRDFRFLDQDLPQVRRVEHQYDLE